MTRTRRILMVAMVATALSADRVLAASPQLRPQMGDAARRLAVRLLVVFRRSMGAARLEGVQRFIRAVRPQPIRLASLVQRTLCHPAELTPFQYRLPPPVL